MSMKTTNIQEEALAWSNLFQKKKLNCDNLSFSVCQFSSSAPDCSQLSLVYLHYLPCVFIATCVSCSLSGPRHFCPVIVRPLVLCFVRCTSCYQCLSSLPLLTCAAWIIVCISSLNCNLFSITWVLPCSILTNYSTS